jgi:uncharacterized membrane protein YphA (DoxX/SURF4 family)
MTITLLRWSIALVLGHGAVGLLTSLAHGGHPGLPPWAALVLGGAELAAAIGLVFPRATRPAGLVLIGTLAVAAAIHIALGAAPPASFLVYGAAIWVVIRHGQDRLRPLPVSRGSEGAA